MTIAVQHMLTMPTGDDHLLSYKAASNVLNISAGDRYSAEGFNSCGKFGVLISA